MRRWGSIFLIVVAVVLACAGASAVASAGGYKVTQVWGEGGEAPGQLYEPKGVAVAADGSVFVADYGNNTVLKFAASGEFLACWGKEGEAPGEFRRPSRVAVGPNGVVYVTDSANHRIQCFSQSGTFLWQWGRHGRGPGQFSAPRGIGIGPDGAVYVTDQNNCRVQVFSARGKYLRQWGSKGTGRGRFLIPKDVAVSGGRVYVVDADAHSVQIFTTHGTWLGAFGRQGSARGRFSYPRGIGVDARGHVFVADAENDRIQEFTGAGGFVREWGCRGTRAGMFLMPRDIDQAPDGSLVVADTKNRRLQRFVRDDAADNLDPLTTCDSPGGWSSAPLSLTLTARDAGSGVAATYASVDGDNFHLAGEPVELTRQGRHVVRYLSVDLAGNQEAVHRRAFTLDWTAPGVRFGSTAPLRASAGGAVTARASVADALSPWCRVWARVDRDGERVALTGLGRVRVSPAGQGLRVMVTAPEAAGTYVLTVTARDAAGNLGRSSRDLIVRAP